MYAILIVSLMIPLLSFSSFSFESITLKRWNSAYQVNINSHYKLESNIDVPKETYQVIAEIYFFDMDFKQHKDCLVYWIPGEKGHGLLKAISAAKNEKCEELIMSDGHAKISGIYNLGLNLKEGHFEIIKDSKKITYKVLNDDFRKNKIGISLYSTSDKGIFLKNGDICFETDNNCHILMKDKCEYCPGKVQLIKSNACSKSFTKICSNDSCGGQGEFACLRGLKIVEKLERYCIVDSPIAFCKAPYRVFCEGEKLICR